MNIVFDATQLIGYTGINVYTRNLVGNLARLYPEDRYTMLTSYHKLDRVFSQFEAATREQIDWRNSLPNPLMLGRTAKPISERIIEQMFRRQVSKADFLHTTDPYHFQPRVPNSIVTVHDIIPLYAEDWVHPTTRKRMEGKLSAIARSRSTIFVPSHFVRKELLEYFDGIAPERVHVTYEGSGNAFRVLDPAENDLSRFGIEHHDRFFLYVGRIDLRKNIERLARAYLSLPQDILKTVKLVLIANGSPEEEKIFRAKCEWHQGIIHLRNVCDEDLVKMMNRALGLSFVSLNEGFGIPILEAMQCGCPVLTSNVTSMPEIAGDAALYIDPYDVAAIAAGLERLASDEELRSTLRTRGFDRAKEFSWERCARETHAGYRAALERL